MNTVLRVGVLVLFALVLFGSAWYIAFRLRTTFSGGCCASSLLGVVDNATDRQLAEVRAREVTGVFSVENDLDVAGRGQEGTSK